MRSEIQKKAQETKLIIHKHTTKLVKRDTREKKDGFKRKHGEGEVKSS